MSNLRKFIIPFFSAVAGGVIAITAVKASPALSSKLGSESKSEIINENKNDSSIYDDIFKKHSEIQDHFDSLLGDDFFNNSDPFENMKRLREKMNKQIQDFGVDNELLKSKPFDSWFSDKFGEGTVNDITMREDDENIYYDIKVNDINSTSIDTKIENNYITISGTVEKKSQTGDSEDLVSKSTFKSTFNRTFPIPENVSENKMETFLEKDKVIIKFPKIKNI